MIQDTEIIDPKNSIWCRFRSVQVCCRKIWTFSLSDFASLTTEGEPSCRKNSDVRILWKLIESKVIIEKIAATIIHAAHSRLLFFIKLEFLSGFESRNFWNSSAHQINRLRCKRKIFRLDIGAGFQVGIMTSLPALLWEVVFVATRDFTRTSVAISRTITSRFSPFSTVALSCIEQVPGIARETVNINARMRSISEQFFLNKRCWRP